MLSFNKPGNEPYYLIQVIEHIRISNQVLVYFHNLDNFQIYPILDLEGLSEPSEAELLLYKKNVPVQELNLRYQKMLAPQFKREYHGVMASSPSKNTKIYNMFKDWYDKENDQSRKTMA